MHTSIFIFLPHISVKLYHDDDDNNNNHDDTDDDDDVVDDILYDYFCSNCPVA
jgi:hypothetical protein